jgi:copper chaperone CopZ
MTEAGLVEARYPVEGLHCDHCVSAVVCEFVELDGVQSAEFDFTVVPPELVVQSLGNLTTEQVTGVLEEAGGQTFTLGAM